MDNVTESVSNPVILELIRDVEHLKANQQQIANTINVDMWKGTYAYNHMHSHMDTWDLLLISVALGLCAYCVWALFFDRSEGESA